MCSRLGRLSNILRSMFLNSIPDKSLKHDHTQLTAAGDGVSKLQQYPGHMYNNNDTYCKCKCVAMEL